MIFAVCGDYRRWLSQPQTSWQLVKMTDKCYSRSCVWGTGGANRCSCLKVKLILLLVDTLHLERTAQFTGKKEPPDFFLASSTFSVPHAAQWLPCERDGSRQESPRVRQLLKYPLLVLRVITRGSLTLLCPTTEIKDSAGIGIPFRTTLVCLKVVLLQQQSQIASVSTQGVIKCCYHSA